MWKKNNDDNIEEVEEKTPRRKISNLIGAGLGSTVRIAKSVPATTASVVSTSVSEFRDGFKTGAQIEDEKTEDAEFTWKAV